MTPSNPKVSETPAANGSRRFALLVALGAVLVALANLRFGVGILAWVAPIPLLHALRLSSGWRARVAFSAALLAAWVAATAKIVTEPLPLGFALLGLGFGATQVVGYLAADVMRRRFGEATGVVAFPALMVSVEWVQHRFTELSSWGATAYTQLSNLPLLQLGAVFGLAGVGFLVNFTAAAFESAWCDYRFGELSRTAKRFVAVALVAVAAAHAFGAARLANDAPGRVKVAAIGTDATFDAVHRPTPAERARTIDHLLLDTRAAARAGAKLAVWTEAAALVMPSEERAFVERLRQTARDANVELVAAYIVLVSEAPLRFENKYQWVRADGSVDHTYLKHHPVPGEPAVRGTTPQRAVATPLGRLAGALCYDYDFPALAAEQAALGVDLVALPSSDWRGIDPLHTEMATLRAIEQGVSIVRSTRFGLSAGIDPYGRIEARRSSFDTNDRVLVFELPRNGVPTPYRWLGDVLVYASLLFVFVTWARSFVRRRTATTPIVTLGQEYVSLSACGAPSGSSHSPNTFAGVERA